MLNGCKVLKMKIPYTLDELNRITIELIARSGLKEKCYIRPLAYKSSESLGVRLHNLEDDFLVFVIPWGPYLDTDRCRVGVSSWRKTGQQLFCTPGKKLPGNILTEHLPKPKPMIMVLMKLLC